MMIKNTSTPVFSSVFQAEDNRFTVYIWKDKR